MLNRTDSEAPPEITALIRRLTLPRYLLRQATVAIHHYSPYSGGMVTSLLQDTVESFLRILSEWGGADVKDTASFQTLIDKVGERFRVVVEHKASILRLNRARVAFKHHGITISESEAAGFASAAEAFLSEVSSEVLGIAFAEISLISEIDHRRTQNWLHKAERFLQSGNYKESCSCASIAMAIYRSFSAQWAREWTRDRPSFFLSREIRNDSKLRELTEWVEESIRPIVQRLDLMMQGVDAASYRRFLAFTPTPVITAAKTIRIVRHRNTANPSESDARFCIDFVVESALRIRDNRLPGYSRRFPSKEAQVAVVERDCDVVVYPDEDPPEIICRAVEGDRLRISDGSSEHHSGYAGVILDGEIYYVPTEDIRMHRDESDRRDSLDPRHNME